MASITISELRPADTDLFLDSETFLYELTEKKSVDVLGGGKVEFHGSYLWGYWEIDLLIEWE